MPQPTDKCPCGSGKLTKTVAVNQNKFSRMTRGFGRVGPTGPPSNAGKPAGRANTFMNLASQEMFRSGRSCLLSFTPLTSSQRPAKTCRACDIWSRATQTVFRQEAPRLRLLLQ